MQIQRANSAPVLRLRLLQMTFTKYSVTLLTIEQHRWAQEAQSCAGKFQSPIALTSSKAIAYPLPALEMIGYHNAIAAPLSLLNNGHSVSLKIAKNAENLPFGRLPYVFGAVFDYQEEYEIEGVHFHWGAKNNRGSEHTLNGVRFPMEMHMIHRNLAYSNVSDALRHKNGLTVLAIFFQLVEKDNEELDPIVSRLAAVRWVNTDLAINSSIILASLLPRNTDSFYTYKGSLTTPPCSEAVTWIVFSTPVHLSYRQMQKFRALSNGEDMLADNYRYLQQIGQRKVYVRRMDAVKKSKPSAYFNVSSISWLWV